MLELHCFGKMDIASIILYLIKWLLNKTSICFMLTLLISESENLHGERKDTENIFITFCRKKFHFACVNVAFSFTTKNKKRQNNKKKLCCHVSMALKCKWNSFKFSPKKPCISICTFILSSYTILDLMKLRLKAKLSWRFGFSFIIFRCKYVWSVYT